jgi:hypothetical protein
LGGYYGCLVATECGYAVPTDAAVRYAEENTHEFDPIEIKRIMDYVQRKFMTLKGRVYWQNVRPENLELYEEEWSKFRMIVNSDSKVRA